MPFEIVRNDIVNMQVDAIVNAANPRPQIGYGVDAGIHKKAGPKLLEARKKIGDLAPGEAAITPAFDLDARYVIHAVGPVWQGGKQGELGLLRRSYLRALDLALEHRCESIAFPLLSAGNCGVPKREALRVAISAFSEFLMEHEMQIYLVVFGREVTELSGKLFHQVSHYIDECYARKKKLEEYGVSDGGDLRRSQMLRRQMELRRAQEQRRCQFTVAPPEAELDAVSAVQPPDLEEMLAEMDAGFSEALLMLIDRSGRKDSEVYKKANVDRKLFSKIRNNPNYKPSKATAVAFALALELDLGETRELIGKAGYALTHSSKFDIIVEYFIRKSNYNIFEINEVLFDFDQPLIGA